ncbi:MAG TPA: SAF domain-containing protein [Nocardioides sp.]|uniref:SAF domain-containing protein n=1 Tax=Nocardioides sp. TaxID=35761 RepID=UPI002F3F00AA
MNLGITDTPAAKRASAPGWRDPRLWLGLVIVAASVLVGALVVGTSDDTVPVWAAADPLGAGQVLTGDDLAVRRVRFDDSDAASLYFRADEQLPADLRLSRDVGAGELLPRAAVGPASEHDLRQVPVSVDPGQVPTAVEVGDTVDVYLRPSSRTGCQESEICDGRPVVAGVTVLDAPARDDGFGADGTRTLVLGMSGGEAQRFFRLLASTDDAALTVVGRG